MPAAYAPAILCGVPCSGRDPLLTLIISVFIPERSQRPNQPLSEGVTYCSITTGRNHHDQRAAQLHFIKQDRDELVAPERSEVEPEREAERASEAKPCPTGSSPICTGVSLMQDWADFATGGGAKVVVIRCQRARRIASSS
jgi:hypothetical protein